MKIYYNITFKFEVMENRKKKIKRKNGNECQ